jgi:hypothetical protein
MCLLHHFFITATFAFFPVASFGFVPAALRLFSVVLTALDAVMGGTGRATG